MVPVVWQEQAEAVGVGVCWLPTYGCVECRGWMGVISTLLSNHVTGVSPFPSGQSYLCSAQTIKAKKFPGPLCLSFPCYDWDASPSRTQHNWVHYSIAAAEIIILVLATLRRSPADISCKGKREGRIRVSKQSRFSFE